MKLIPLCNCEDDKVITGNWNGEMIWREKTSSEMKDEDYHFNVEIPTLENLEDRKWETYQANSD